MAQIPNPNALTVSDGLNTFLNIDTKNKIISFGNAATSYAASATAPDPGNNGTISTAGLGTTKVTPAAAETGVILQAGTVDGQEVTVINLAAAANTITFAAAATSNVSDGTGDVITGLTARTYVWEASSSRWYPFK